MTDLQTAVMNLGGHSVCLCKSGEWFTADGRGIAPVLKLMAERGDLSGHSAADVIVGKAAAMLFVKAGISAVHGRVMSEAGKKYLEERGIPCTWDTLTEKIINRAGTDVCPMEKTVADIEDAELGYKALCAKVIEMQGLPPIE
jgi:hypothetical protein